MGIMSKLYMQQRRNNLYGNTINRENKKDLH